MQTIDINFLGDGGVGKTAWIRNIKENPFEPRYYATVGLEINQVIIYTNYGPFLVNLWDYAGQEKYSSKQGVQQDNTATILMFDLTSKVSYKSMKTHWYSKCCKTKPIFIVGNKCDCEDIKVFPDDPYLAVSAKRMGEKDLLTPILRSLTGHEDLVITE